MGSMSAISKGSLQLLSLWETNSRNPVVGETGKNLRSPTQGKRHKETQLGLSA